jgi:hypothetical protein
MPISLVQSLFDGPLDIVGEASNRIRQKPEEAGPIRQFVKNVAAYLAEREAESESTAAGADFVVPIAAAE